MLGPLGRVRSQISIESLELGTWGINSYRRILHDVAPRNDGSNRAVVVSPAAQGRGTPGEGERQSEAQEAHLDFLSTTYVSNLRRGEASLAKNPSLSLSLLDRTTAIASFIYIPTYLMRIRLRTANTGPSAILKTNTRFTPQQRHSANGELVILRTILLTLEP